MDKNFEESKIQFKVQKKKQLKKKHLNMQDPQKSNRTDKTCLKKGK